MLVPHTTAFQQSALHQAIMAKGEGGEIPGGFYLIGDEAYVARDWMVVPYSGQQLPEDKDAANYYISLDRQVIERCFGVLVSRFGVLRRPLTCRTARVPKLLGALARLHNMCLKEKLPRSVDFGVGDLPIVHPQDECDDGEQGRRREVEASAPRREIREWLVRCGRVRPPHSRWGRRNDS